ncbi:MAG: hypothetical protein H7Y86_20350 [Rhizobacter sp.]|nr:hypothetical protein [Ferruginibacter sp.]
MKNKKNWIALKAGFIIMLLLYFFVDSTTDKFRLFIRIAMLAVFTFSLLRDVNELKNNK